MAESKKRAPNRTPQEKLEDAFFDMSVPEQEAMLGTLQTLHRMKIRTTSEQPKPVVQPTAIKADAISERGENSSTVDGYKKPWADPQGSLIDGPAAETSIKLKESADPPIR